MTSYAPGGTIGGPTFNGGPSFNGGPTLNDFNNIGQSNVNGFLETVGDIQAQSGEDTVAALRRQVIRNQQNRAFDEGLQRFTDAQTQFKNVVNTAGGATGA